MSRQRGVTTALSSSNYESDYVVYSLIFPDDIKKMHICHGNLFRTCQDTHSGIKGFSSKDPLRSLLTNVSQGQNVHNVHNSLREGLLNIFQKQRGLFLQK